MWKTDNRSVREALIFSSDFDVTLKWSTLPFFCRFVYHLHHDSLFGILSGSPPIPLPTPEKNPVRKRNQNKQWRLLTVLQGIRQSTLYDTHTPPLIMCFPSKLCLPTATKGFLFFLLFFQTMLVSVSCVLQSNSPQPQTCMLTDKNKKPCS